MRRIAIRAALAVMVLPLAGCAGFWTGDVARAPATEITADPTGEGTVHLRSAQPRFLAWLDPRPEATIPVETARAAPVAEIVDVVHIASPGADPAQGGPVALGPYTPERAAQKLPFGEVATVCGIAPATRGKEVDAGPGGFRLYDTGSGSLAPRTHYIDGFADGCARRFTATLAQLGSVAGHEAMRYNPLNQNPWSETDAAYEAVKARICAVPQGTPCDGPDADALIRAGAFVSVYQGFGPEARWLEMFLHDGALVTAEAR